MKSTRIERTRGTFTYIFFTYTERVGQEKENKGERKTEERRVFYWQGKESTNMPWSGGFLHH